MKRLAIITTHPIQYYAPVFQLLSQRRKIEIKVFYTRGEETNKGFDPQFSRNINWDLNLLDAYEFEWLKNTSRKPGSHGFMGVINPDIIPQIDRFGPTALLVFGWAYNSHLKVLRHYQGKVPVYFRGDSNILNAQFGFKDIAKTLFLKWVYKKVDYALYVGSANRNYFKKYGLKDKQLVYAPHAVDNERFAGDRSEGATQLRKSLNLRDAEIVILFAGKFIETKNPLLLIEAVKNINDSNVHLLMVGNGPMQSQLMAAAAGYSNIHFQNFQNQTMMPVIYQACNLFCLPSQGETWGLVVNEAMACGKAVVVSDKCGCAVDLVKPGINGYIFKSNYLDDLIDSLKVLCDRDRLQKYGDVSKEIIKDFSFLHIAKAIENLVNETQRPY